MAQGVEPPPMSEFDPTEPEAIGARLDALRKKLAARTKPDGSALPNFAENVAAIRAEIERLEAK